MWCPGALPLKITGFCRPIPWGWWTAPTGGPAYATRDVEIPKNTRLCQFRIVENQPPLVFTRVERLESPDRGGFGSTGK